MAERQPGKLKVFISYSRADEAFADELRLGLEDKGYAVEVDKHSIRQGEEWKARLAKLIAASDTVVFVLSPNSARSPVCHWEVEEAHAHGKRIVPVLHRGLHEPPKGTQPDGSPWPEGPATAPPRLTLINYPRFDEGRSFMAGLRGLVQALEDDLDWIEAHSRLAARARDWDEGGRATNRLMSGADIAAAKRLIETRKPSAPPMLRAQLDFIQASVAHETAQLSEREREAEEKRRLAEEALTQSRLAERRIRIVASAALFLAFTAAVAGGLAWQQRQVAVAEASRAEAASIDARSQAQRAEINANQAFRTQSGLLAGTADNFVDSDPGLAVLLALEGMPDATESITRPLVPETQFQLDRAYRTSKELMRRHHDFSVTQILFSPDDRLLAAASDDGAVRLFEVATGLEKARLQHDVKTYRIRREGAIDRATDFGTIGDYRPAPHRQKTTAPQLLPYNFSTVVFSPDSRLLASVSSDGTAQLFEAQTGIELLKLQHSEVHQIAFSPDGNLLATASADGTARLFETASGRELAQLVHVSKVREVAFSPDGHLLASRSDEWSVRVFEVATGRERARLVHGDIVSRVAFSPDGRLVATASADRTARLFEASSGRELVRLSHGNRVEQIAFSPDGRLLATASADRMARLFDTKSEREISQLVHQDQVTQIAFSPDGRLLATASADRMARLFDAQTGRERAKFMHESSVHRVAFSSDGWVLATASADNVARLFEVATGNELARWAHEGSVDLITFNSGIPLLATAASDKTVRLFQPGVAKRGPHDGRVWSVAFSPDGRLLATASADKSARLIEATTGRERARLYHSGEVFRLEFSRDGRLLATASADKLARLYDVATGKELVRLPHDDLVHSLAVSPTGRLVATVSDKTVRLFETSSGKELSRHSQGGTVNLVAFSPNSRMIATASVDKTARLYETATGRELQRISHGARVWSVAFSPDGRFLTTHSDDGIARLFETATGKEWAKHAQDGEIQQIVFSLDSRLLVTVSNDGTVRLVEPVSGKELVRLSHLENVNQIALSPNGRLLATAHTTHSAVRLFETASGREVTRLAGDGSQIVFSSDGRLVATRSDKGTVRLFEALSGRELAQLKHGSEVYQIAFSPSTEVLMSVTADHVAHLWEVFPTAQSLVDAAKARTARCLTQAQRAQYFLPAAPPTWCVERRLWPYHGDEWLAWLPQQKGWLAGGRQGDAPPLPKAE